MPEERIVITIHPSSTDEGLLSVSDAMRQVIDALRIFEEAQRALASPDEAFDWRLERASTNTPFTVTAIATPKNPSIDVSEHVRRVKSTVSSGLRDLVANRAPSWWMGPEAIAVARSVFDRNLNGIWRTDIEISPDETLTVDRNLASDGVRAIGAISAIDDALKIPERIAWGEIEGLWLRLDVFVTSQQFKSVRSCTGSLGASYRSR